MARAAPSGALTHACSSTQRPIGTISPLSSASGMNVVGEDDAPLGMAPAQQRLDPDRALGAQVERRLVDEEQLLALERLDEVHLEPEAVLRRRLHAGFEHHAAVLAGGLGDVQRDVGIGQELLGALVEAVGDRRCLP